MTETLKLKKYLRANNIRIADLASKINLSEQSLGRTINSGDIKISKLRQIARALNVPISTFIDDYYPDKPDRMRQLEEKIETLSAKVDKVSSL